MSKKLKEKPNLDGDRVSFKDLEPQDFSYGKYSYRVTPLGMRERIRWGRLSTKRAKLENDYYLSAGEAVNPFIAYAALVASKSKEGDSFKGEEDEWQELVARLDSDENREYERLVSVAREGQAVALESFAETEWDELYNTICSKVQIVAVDGVADINRSYLEFYLDDVNELLFIWRCIDNASTLSKAEVLGLK